MEKSLLRRGLAQPGRDGLLVGVSAAEAHWRYIDFSANQLASGQELTGETGTKETALMLLSGTADFQAAGRSWGRLEGRSGVFDSVGPYTLLLPPGVSYQVRAAAPVHLAVAAATPAGPSVPPRLITPDETGVELRGAGGTARQVRNILPETEPAGGLLLVEVITPAGNWSSYPPHKHDTDDPPRETYLEEVYYYQFSQPQGYALQRVYTDDRRLNETLAPGHSDLVLVPAGYHPVAAAPGYDCYYLNVMAGPVRRWCFTPDPQHVWLMNWSK